MSLMNHRYVHIKTLIQPLTTVYLNNKKVNAITPAAPPNLAWYITIKHEGIGKPENKVKAGDMCSSSGHNVMEFYNHAVLWQS
jgi:hypothetical protein